MIVARTRLTLASVTLALAMLLLARPFAALAAPAFALDVTADADTIVGGAVETRLRVQNSGDVPLDTALLTHPVPAELTVTSITTGPATAIEYQKNGGATWIPGVPLGPSVAVGAFPGFIAGDYVSGLRFRLTAVAVGFDNSQISVRSTAVNPPNGGGAAYALPHTVVSSATLDGAAQGAPLAQASDSAATLVDVPKARPAPQIAILAGSPALPGDTVRYRLTMANGTFAPLDNPVIADLLPAAVSYTPGSWTLPSNINGCASTPAFSSAPNFNGSGRTLLLWSWAGTGCSIPPDDRAQIEFAVRVNAGTYPTGAGSIPNRLALVDFSTPTTLVRKDSCAADPAESALFTGAGYSAAKLCLSPAAGLRVDAAAAIGSAKYVRGQLDSVFHIAPQVGQTVQAACSPTRSSWPTPATSTSRTWRSSTFCRTTPPPPATSACATWRRSAPHGRRSWPARSRSARPSRG